MKTIGSVGLLLAQAEREVAAGHPRHHDVGDEEVDRPLACDDAHGLDAVARLQDRVAGLGEDAARQVAQRVGVLDEQHRLAARRRRPRASSSGSSRAGSSVAGSESVSVVPSPSAVSRSTLPPAPVMTP